MNFITSIEDGSVETRQAKIYITPDLIGDNQPTLEDEISFSYAGETVTGVITSIDTKKVDKLISLHCLWGSDG